MNIIIINGGPGVGKDTFATLCQTAASKVNCDVYQVSTVDHVRQLVKIFGLDSTKTPEMRKMMSDAKDFLDSFGDTSTSYVCDQIDKIDERDASAIVFIHCREPKKIVDLQTVCKMRYNVHARTLLIKRNIERTELNRISNHADANVEDFQYDSVIDNYGDMQVFQQQADYFMKAFVL